MQIEATEEIEKNRDTLAQSIVEAASETVDKLVVRNPESMIDQAAGRTEQPWCGEL